MEYFDYSSYANVRINGHQSDNWDFLSNFKNMIILEIIDCRLNSYDFTKFKHLETLILTANDFDQIPKIPSKVKKLKISRNLITEISGDYPNLRKLDLSSNLLVKIELPKFLTELNLSGCALKSLDNIPKTIKKLYLTNNQLENITLHNGLKILDVSFNKIKEIIGVRSLKSLRANHNQIKSITNLTYGIKYLSATNNNLTSDNIFNLIPDSINELILDHNPIYQVIEIPKNMIYLSLQYCELLEINNLPRNLEYLNLNKNYLSVIPELNSKLLSLNVSNNQIINFPILNDVIENLDISENNLIITPDKYPESLKTLSINGNPIINFKIPVSISELNMDRCQLDQIQNIQGMKLKFIGDM